MQRLTEVDLTRYSTFALPARADTLIVLESEADCNEFFSNDSFSEGVITSPAKLAERSGVGVGFYLLGSGSNTVFCSDIPLVVHNQIMGWNMLVETDDHVDIRIGSGENWADSVIRIAEMGLWGTERLAAIPGTVGAAPVQNIGAYGAELRDVCLSVRAYDCLENNWNEFTNEECEFSYRDSIFKRNPGRYCITSVVLRLSRERTYSDYYAGVGEALARESITIPAPMDMVRVVTDIRAAKLPDWRTQPNCGSFFGNPIVSADMVAKLRAQYTDIPVYPYGEEFKLAAGWLIEQTVGRGFCIGNICTSDTHALVLVNRDGSPQQLLQLVDHIITTVQQKFNVTLIPEPNIVRM